MKTKQLYFLLIILAALGVGTFIRQSQKPPQLSLEEYTPLDLSFDPAKIEKIVIEKLKNGKAADDNTRIEMAKEQGGWKIRFLGNARASESKVGDLLKEIRDAKGELRGRGEKIFQDFGIGDPDSFHVTLSTNAGPALELVLGTKDPGNGVFLRKKDSESVYLAEADLFGRMGVSGNPANATLPKDFWAATNFLDMDPNRVRGLKISTFEQGKETVKADIKGSGALWSYNRPGMPFQPGGEKTAAFIAALTTRNAEKILDPNAQDYGFDKPTWRMNITFDGGEEKVFTAGKRDNETEAVYINVKGDPTVYQMSKYFFQSLEIDDTAFMGENPLGIETDKIEKLTVRSGKEELTASPAQKKWDSLNYYIDDLKNIRFTRLVLDPKEQKIAGQQSLEVVLKDGKSYFLQAGGPIEGGKEYPVSFRGSQAVLALPQAVYKQLFEKADRLKEPQVPAKK